MDPLTLLIWIGAITLSVIIVAITTLIVWTVVQTMRGKPVTKNGRR